MNNFSSGVGEIMPLTITDDQLINMPSDLLVELQQYLKGYKEKGREQIMQNSIVNFSDTEIHPTNIESDVFDDGEVWVLSDGDQSEVQFKEVRSSTDLLGIQVVQADRTYIGRGWKLTNEVKRILTTAFDLGFKKFWRYNHPRDSYLLGGPDYQMGSQHIGVSRNHSDQWVFVLDKDGKKTELGVQKVRKITFSKHYLDIIKRCPDLSITNGPLNPGTYMIQKGGGRDINIHPADFDTLIHFISEKLTR